MKENCTIPGYREKIWSSSSSIYNKIWRKIDNAAAFRKTKN